MSGCYKLPRLTKSLNFRPEDGCYDLCAEDNKQWISIMALDAYIADEVEACSSCLDLSYDEAERLAIWLTRRVAVARRVAASETQRKTEGVSHG